MDTIVLIADHEMCRRQELRRFLLRSGFLVTVASDGLETLSEMVALSPDVLVIAWDLPCCGCGGIISRLNLGLPVNRMPLVKVLGTPSEDRVAKSGVAVSNWLPTPIDKQSLLDGILSGLPPEIPDIQERMTRARNIV
jgi:DNA-binding response OmpR family regulator